MASQNFQIVIKAFDKTAKGLGSATRGIAAVAGSVLNLKTALVGVAGVAGFGLLVKSSLDATDSLAKTASKIGTTTEELSKLRYAADLTGVSATTMDMALQRFTRRTAEAAKGTGEAKAALKELGLDAKALVNMPLSERMLALSDSFSGARPEAEKLALAFKLFDSEGAALVNTLALGKDGLNAMFAEAETLGVVMSKLAADDVQKANDSFTRLRTLLRGFRDQTVAKLAPAIQLITDKIVEFGKSASGGDFENIGSVIANKIIAGFKTIVRVFQSILNIIGETAHEMKRIYRNIFSSQETKRNEAELKKLETAALRAGISIKKALDPDDSYSDRLSEDNRKLVSEINRIRNELNQIENRETTAYVPFDFSGLLASLDEAGKAIGSVSDGTDPLNDGVDTTSNLFTQFGTAVDTVRKQLPSIEDGMMGVAKQLSDGVTNGFTDAITGAKSFSDAMKDMAKSVINSLIKMMIQYHITKPLMEAVGAKLGIPAGGTATGKAIGGSVQAGQPYMVGERGQELFVPNQSGSIIPNNELGGGSGVVVNQTINVSTGVQQTVRAEISNLMPQIQEATKSAVADARARGGSYSKALLGA